MSCIISPFILISLSFKVVFALSILSSNCISYIFLPLFLRIKTNPVNFSILTGVEESYFSINTSKNLFLFLFILFLYLVDTTGSSSPSITNKSMVLSSTKFIAF